MTLSITNISSLMTPIMSHISDYIDDIDDKFVNDLHGVANRLLSLYGYHRCTNR